tara:strand:+ start:391 stop:786 length:396 start_codon:yes stop_codon:yes gene_type:complete
MVQFSLAQLAKEEEARKRKPMIKPTPEPTPEPTPKPTPKPYVNPDFARKEAFKQKDSTDKQLGGFNPGTKLYSSQRTDVGSDDSLRITRNNPMGLVKPLQPNILDAAADERQKELAKQRAMAGHKWVLLHR